MISVLCFRYLYIIYYISKKNAVVKTLNYFYCIYLLIKHNSILSIRAVIEVSKMFFFLC